MHNPLLKLQFCPYDLAMDRPRIRSSYRIDTHGNICILRFWFGWGRWGDPWGDRGVDRWAGHYQTLPDTTRLYWAYRRLLDTTMNNKNQTRPDPTRPYQAPPGPARPWHTPPDLPGPRMLWSSRAWHGGAWCGRA